MAQAVLPKAKKARGTEARAERRNHDSNPAGPVQKESQNNDAVQALQVHGHGVRGRRPRTRRHNHKRNDWREEAGLIPEAGGDAADGATAGDTAGERPEFPKKPNRRGDGEWGGGNAGATPRRTPARAGTDEAI